MRPFGKTNHRPHITRKLYLDVRAIHLLGSSVTGHFCQRRSFCPPPIEKNERGRYSREETSAMAFSACYVCPRLPASGRVESLGLEVEPALARNLNVVVDLFGECMSVFCCLLCAVLTLIADMFLSILCCVGKAVP